MDTVRTHTTKGRFGMRATSRPTRILIRSSVVISAILVTLPGCQQKKTDTGASQGTVQVGLTEWAVSVVPNKVSAGDIKFEVKNNGTKTHEFVVIATDLDLTELPTAEDGSVDEEAQGMKVIDEIEDVEAGTNRSLDVKIGPGNYVFICNVVDTKEDGTKDLHYQMGMRTSVKVT